MEIFQHQSMKHQYGELLKNVNGINPYGYMGDFLTILERLRALQAGTIAFSKTNVESHKFLLRDNTQSLLQKAFGAATVEYSTSSRKFEMTHNKPGGGHYALH
jgi:hypothetical protein